MSQIARTIKTQIVMTDPMALFAWGAKDFSFGSNMLQFKTSGMTPWKGYVEISYNEGSDLYEILFFRIRKGALIVDNKETDVYAEDLVRLIDSFVG